MQTGIYIIYLFKNFFLIEPTTIISFIIDVRSIIYRCTARRDYKDRIIIFICAVCKSRAPGDV